MQPPYGMGFMPPMPNAREDAALQHMGSPYPVPPGPPGFVQRGAPFAAPTMPQAPGISLPGQPMEETRDLESREYLAPNAGRTSDAMRMKSRAKPGAFVKLNFDDPQCQPLTNPKFIFPDPIKPDVRPWLPIFTSPWYSFDNPIDNMLVRGTSFVVFLCALFLFIFGVVLCEDCEKGFLHACSLCPRHHGVLHDTPYVWYIQPVAWYDFLIRTVFGMSCLSPFAVTANFFLKILDVNPDMVPSLAKRFSFFLGIILNTVLFVLHFVADNPFQRGPALALIIFSALESIGGFCVGCWFYGTFFRMKDRWELRNDYRQMALREANPARPALAEHRGVKAPLFALQLFDNVSTPQYDRSFDYDLVVIGGGSGGLAASKEAARIGAKVAVLDFVKPTPYGSRWGLGGTCVNVGCIPKKLFHTAAIYGHYLHEAGLYGWDSSATGKPVQSEGYTCNWERLRKGIQDHIKSLNNGYITGLKSAQVEYINARGSFIDAHTICCDATCPTLKCPGSRKTKITARRVIIAVGGRPQYPDIPGAKEYAITSDDIFSLERSPGKTLVVGASYIALECGGFLTGLGFETSVMVRSIVLRGFDRDCADRIKGDMVASGTRFIDKSIPVKIESTPEGLRKVTYENVETKQQHTEVFETVVFAIGREPVTKELNLEAAGVKLAPDNKIWTWNERTTAGHVYAVGDCSHKTPELTPVAIKQGLTLAKRIYLHSKDDLVNLDHVPTTVFTPLEYGSIGFSEERAIEAFGEDNIEVYHSEFTPLEYTVPHRKTRCYAKIIVNYLDKERVIGFHYLGPNAGEVTQGYAAGFIAGLHKSDFDLIVGIHPTCAEEMVSLRRTKRSGMDPKKTGC